MKLRVKAYAPNGASLGVLPAPSKVTASLVLGDTGALSLEYGETAPRATLLDAPCELAVEVSRDDGATWVEPDDCRFVYLRRKGDSVKRPSRVTAEAAAYSWRLGTAKVLPNGLLNTDGKRAFLSATPGTILGTLIQEAQTRGALTGITKDFTTTLDSAGNAWANTVTLYYEPGKDYLAILRNLFDQGLVDFRFRGRLLQVFNADTAMARRLDAANPVVDLRYGRDLTEAPWTGTWEALANFAYVEGDNGVTLERTNGSATAPWGRQETYIAQGGVSDLGTMTTLADASLGDTAAERMERTYGLALGKARWLPSLDYTLGDFVAVGDTGDPLGHLIAYRVRQVTLTRDENANVGGNAVLNDRFVEQEIRTTRRVLGITGGSTIAGGSGATPTPVKPGVDTISPAAPSGLASATAAYLDDQGLPHAQVTLTWAAVTTNTDATLCDDLARYEVYAWATATPSDVTVYPTDITASGGTVRWSASPFRVGSAQSFKVRAVDMSGNDSSFSGTINVTMAADTTPPVTPSTPTTTVRLGTVMLAWDGKDNAGAAMALDTKRVDIHRSTTSGFTPATGTLAGSLTKVGAVVFADQTYGTTWYYRLVAYDTSGNVSPASVQASAVTTPLVGADIIGTPIDGTKLVAYSITAGQLAVNSVTANSIQAGTITGVLLAADTITAREIGAGVITAAELSATAIDAMTITGALIRTAASGNRWQLNGAGAIDTVEGYTGITGETPAKLTVSSDIYNTFVTLAAPMVPGGGGGSYIEIDNPRTAGIGSVNVNGDLMVMNGKVSAVNVYEAASNIKNFVFGGGTSLAQTITFPAGRFSVAPNVTVSLVTAYTDVFVRISGNPTTTSVNVTVWTSAAKTATFPVQWIAIAAM